MPAERRDALRNFREDLARREVDQAPHEVEARSAYARRVHLLQFAVGHAAIDGRHAARAAVRGAEGIDEGTVVAAVARCLDDDVSVEAKPIAKRKQLVLR